MDGSGRWGCGCVRNLVGDRFGVGTRGWRLIDRDGCRCSEGGGFRTGWRVLAGIGEMWCILWNGLEGILNLILIVELKYGLGKLLIESVGSVKKCLKLF